METTSVPLAIVNGEDDPFIQADYFGTLAYASLWPQGVVEVSGASHAPFLQAPGAFNALLKHFADSVQSPS
ncbi:MAG TPA: alpha/beta hydrolase [Mesorhizobium sp.]